MPTSHTPQAMVVMSPEVYDLQFDAVRTQRLDRLVSLGDLAPSDTVDSPAARERAAEVEVLITSWGAPALTAERLAYFPRLRAVFHCAGSVRTLVSEELWDRGIVVTNAADENAIPVAEFTLAAIVFAGKKAPFLSSLAQREAARGALPRSTDTFGPLSNFGRTIGVVGFSRIGRRVVELVQSLEEVTCLVVDPLADATEVAAAGGTLVTLEEMLPRVDVLSLHAPSLPSTEKMISAEQLALLGDHATVVNTARGRLVDTAALERECASGRLNAILDVTDPEPLPAGSVLFTLPNVMVTPHIAGSLDTETHRMTNAALDQLELFLAGRPLTSQITRDVLGVSA